MNNMKVIISDDVKPYRVIVTQVNVSKDVPCYALCYKVQVQIWLFWITIKEFEEGIYDNDSEFCKREAVELYNKIVNPYG